MVQPDPQAAREFAVYVVRRLREAGYEALWAGGCVRDQLLGLQPKDYDVATSAPPDEVRRVFGRRSTLAVGAAFGVITVLGRKPAGQIEVATFRRDAAYSDGRHPDSVTFSSAEEDARRRDFTINGLFYDPLDERTIDYVGGEHDLRRGIIRAIGNPHERFDEDKLRMLRAVRFTATFGFEADAETLAAIREHAHELVIVSVERVLQELQRMLVHPHRRRAIELLDETRLLEIVFPELEQARDVLDEEAGWSRFLASLECLRNPTFAVAMATVLRPLYLHDGLRPVESTARRLRLTNDDLRVVRFCLQQEGVIREARRAAWPRLQRVLVAPAIASLMTYVEAIAWVEDGRLDDIDYCRSKLALPPDELNPLPLITGDDLKAAGVPPGRAYQRILTNVRDAQLLGRLVDRDQALDAALQLWREPPGER